MLQGQLQPLQRLSASSWPACGQAWGIQDQAEDRQQAQAMGKMWWQNIHGALQIHLWTGTGIRGTKEVFVT